MPERGARGGGVLLVYVSTHSLVNLRSLKRRRWGTFYFMNLLKLDIIIHFLRCWTGFGNGLLLVRSQDFMAEIVQIIVF